MACTAPQVKGEYSLMVIGKSGNGKSTLCNTILGENVFETGAGMASTTVTAGYAECDRFQLKLKVLDTLDITNLDTGEIEIRKEVEKWHILTKHAPTVILLAVRCDVRYTAEEYAIYRQILKLWGKHSLRLSLVVAFTFGDRQDRDIREELKTVCPELKQVLKDANGRYRVFNNQVREEEKDRQVLALIEVIHDIEKHGETGSCVDAICCCTTS